MKTLGGLAIFGALAYSIISVNNCKPLGPHVVTTQTTIKITDTSTNLVLASAGQYANYQGGKTQTLTIQNVGAIKALDVDSNLLSILNVIGKGLMVVDNNCPQDLEPNATCTFTFHPSIQLKPTKFKIHGINTNDVEATITVLDYGSQYQDGYVYALTPYVFGDDLDKNKCNPDTLEHCSKIVTLADQKYQGNDKFSWAVSKPQVLFIGDYYNGKKNTKALVNSIPRIVNSFNAAGFCAQLTTENGYKDWYLPAICELQSKKSGSQICDDTNTGDIATLMSALSIKDLNKMYWSSTQSKNGPDIVYIEDMQDKSKIGPVQVSWDEQNYNVRCSRAIIPENVVQ